MDGADPLDELLICRLDLRRKSVEPGTVVIFGASGDLTSRKLIPALYHLHCEGQLPSPCRIIGFARRPKSDEAWRSELRESLDRFSRTGSASDGRWESFAGLLSYCQGDLEDAASFERLRARIEESSDERLRSRRTFYLATLPSLFAVVARHLAKAGLLR